MQKRLETALENAKIALEEAFKPRIQSMLSAKLKEVGDEEEYEDEFGGEEEEGDLPVELVSKSYRDDDQAEDEFGGGEEGGEEVPAAFGAPEEVPAAEIPIDVGDEEVPGEVPGEEEEEFEEEGVIEINGVKYAPVVAEDEVPHHDAPVYEEDQPLNNLDLEAVIKELENELSEDEDLEEGDNPYESPDQHNDWVDGENGKPKEIHKKEKFAEGEDKEDEDDDKEEVDEGAGSVDEDSTKLGFDPTGSKKRNIDEPSLGSLKNEGKGEKKEDMVEIDLDEDDKEEVDEELKSSGIGKSDNHNSEYFSADTENSETGVVKKKFSEDYKSVKKELKEYKEAVVFLKDRLHEVNILNAKLLFTNKLFKEFVLDNNQKMKVVETFDRAQTVREIKLVYSTLAESFQGNSNVTSKTTLRESAGGASKPVKSTKPSQKVITEESQVANRFKKLAGLLNG